MGLGLAELMRDTGLLVTMLTDDRRECDALFGVPQKDGSKPGILLGDTIGPLDIKMHITDDMQRDVLSRSIVFDKSTPDEATQAKLRNYYLDSFTRQEQLSIWTIDFYATGLAVHYHYRDDATKADVVVLSCEQVPNETLQADFICTHRESDMTLKVSYEAIYGGNAHGYILRMFVDDEKEPRAQLGQRFRRA